MDNTMYMMPLLQNLETEETLHTVVQEHLKNNPYLLEKPEIDHILEQKQLVLGALHLVESGETAGFTEEQLQRRKLILIASKVGYQDKFVQEAEKTYVDRSKLERFEFKIDQGQRKKELEELKQEAYYAELERQAKELNKKKTGGDTRSYLEKTQEVFGRTEVPQVTIEEHKWLMENMENLKGAVASAETLLSKTQMDRNSTEAYQVILTLAQTVIPTEKIQKKERQIFHIDREQTKEDVESWTNTEWYKDLQTRAHSIRKNRQDTTQTPTPEYKGNETITELGN